jgi:hypothetical protein
VTSIEMTYSGAWVPLDLEGDPAATAAAVVAARWAEDGLPHDPEREQLIVGALRGQFERYAAEDPQPLTALMLYPAADEIPVAFATVRFEPLDEPLDFDTLADELSIPEPMLERPLEQGMVETPTGPALRLRQCYREPESPEEERVYDVLTWAWILGDVGEQVLVLFSTAFHDLSESQLWRESFDEMARSVNLVLE